MAELPVRPLPRGRHGLSRDEVATSQRLRMLLALADAMMDKGYVSTSVADVIKRAGVSRETFYQQFSSKLDCFMTAFDVAGEALIETIEATVDIDRRDLGADDGRDAATRLAQFEQVFTAYLDALASQPGYARLFLVEVFAAGPEAIRRRGELEGRLVDILAALLGVGSEHGRFACEVLVAAIGAMVIEPLVAYDLSALRELRGPVVDLVRRAFEVDAC
jgi:AcrR family transcriptional regulator